MADASDRERVLQVLEGLTRTDPTIGTQARQAMRGDDRSEGVRRCRASLCLFADRV
jgi:hypothetical protein